MKKFKILAIILIICFAFAIVPRTFQNDTFYTVTIGRDILRYGLDGIDHYSWHEGLSYTSPHWLFDVVNYLIYSVADFDGLYLFVCIITSITLLLFYFFLRKKNVNWLIAFARNNGFSISCKRFFYRQSSNYFIYVIYDRN